MRREVVVHLALPYFQGDQLSRTIHSNARTYSGFGLDLPDPHMFQKRLARLLTSTDERVRSGVLSDAVKRSIGGRSRHRTFISLRNVPNEPHEIANRSGLLPDLNVVIKRLYDFFEGDKLVLAIGVVNPGQLLSVLAQAKLKGRAIGLREIVDTDYFWSDALGACVDEFPELRVIAWRHEESATLWPLVLRIVGMVPREKIAPGSLDMVAHILSKEGLDQLIKVASTQRLKDDFDLCATIKSFLREYPATREPRKPRPLNGWSAALSEAFDLNYEVDIGILSREERICFLDMAGRGEIPRQGRSGA